MKVRAKVSVFRTNGVMFRFKGYGILTYLKIRIRPNAPRIPIRPSRLSINNVPGTYCSVQCCGSRSGIRLPF